MQGKDIYVGTIMQCNNCYQYKKYGEERFVPDFRINDTECGHVEEYASEYRKQAVLIRVAVDQYVWLKSITNFKDEFLLNHNFSINSISTIPTSDDELFINESSLIPYFSKEKENKFIKVKQLRKTVLMDPRIKGGIEH